MVGSVPWHIKNIKTGEIVDKSSNVAHTHPLAKAIKGVKLAQDFGLFELWEYSLCIWGESYFEKLRTPLNFFPPLYPTGFYWLNPIDVTPFAPFGEIETITYIGTNANGRVVQLDRDEFIFSRYFNPLDITSGISPLEVALTDINVEANAKAFAKTFFRNNARPGLIFYPKADGDGLSDAQINQMRRLISEQWAGIGNAGMPQILNAPVDVKTLDSQNLDDQSDSTERLSRDILAAFGVPRSLAGDTDSAQYKANDDVMRWFIQTTIEPECVRMADTVNTHMLSFFDTGGAFVFEFDFSKYEVVTEADKAKQDLNEQRFGSTAMTLFEYQKQSGIDKPDDRFKDLWKVEGYSGFVPTDELR
ncbi:MAG: phage portal protein, partial [Deefgea sp.]